MNKKNIKYSTQLNSEYDDENGYNNLNPNN